jgi:triosephosphate isomerase
MSSARKTYIIANWKMNFTPGEASLYLHRLQERVDHIPRNLQLVLAPSIISLQSLSLQINRRQFKLAAQNFNQNDYGAYTGEVSVTQLRGFVDYAICGHSERRYKFHETDKEVGEKVAAAIRNGLTPILRIGETAEERKNHETATAIYSQLAGGLHFVSEEDVEKVIIAYEPVWPISSNKGARPANPTDIEEAAALIRKHVSRIFGKETAEKLSILYGGSVNKDTAGGFLEVAGIDGLLIGNASLVADSFCAIIDLAKGKTNER